MAGAKRRSYKKKGVARRRKSKYTKRKSTKKTYRKRAVRRYKKKKLYRKRTYRRRVGRSKGPSLAEMAFVVAKHHPAAEAVENAQTVQAAVSALPVTSGTPVVSQMSDAQFFATRSRDEFD